MSRSSTIKRRRSRNYAVGANNALGAFIREAVRRNLSPQEVSHLLVDFWEVTGSMCEARDTFPPFLTQAMAKTLDRAGLEDYETAYQRILKENKIDTALI